MASDAEIETLIVRLTGEGSEFQKMMMEANQNLEKTSQHVEEAGHRIEGIGERLEGFASKIKAALVATAEFEFLKETYEAFAGREKIFIGLNAALEVNGRAIKSTTDAYKEFAKETAHASLVSSDETINLLKKAEAYELTGRAAEKATSDAVNIAAVNDGNAESLMRVTAAMAKGDMQMAMHMARQIEQLRFVKDEAEFRRIYNRLVETGMKTNEALSKSAEGATHHLSAAWRGLKKELGETSATVLKPLFVGLTDVINLLRQLPGPVKAAAMMFVGLSAGITALAVALPLISTALVSVKASLIAFSLSIAVNPLTAWIVALGAAALAIYGLGSMVKDQLPATKDMNMELERSVKITKGLDEATKHRLALKEQKIDKRTPDAGPERRSNLAGGIETAKKEIAGYEREIKRITKEQESLSWWTIGYYTKLKGLNSELDQTKSLLDIANQHSANLEASAKKISLKDALKEASEFADTLEEETLYAGKTADEIKRLQLAEEGLSDAQLKYIDRGMREKKDAEDHEKLKKAIEEAEDAVYKEISTYDMNEREKERWSLMNQKATESELKLFDALHDLKDKWDDQTEAMERGEEVFESLKTPVEKFNDTQADLNELFKQGAIDLNTYQRGIRAAKKELEGMNNTQNDAVLSNSAEARSRMLAYQEALKIDSAEVPDYAKKGAKGGRGGGDNPPTGSVAGSRVDSAEAVKKIDDTNEILKVINTGIQTIAKTKPGQLKVADFSGTY